MGLKVFAVEVIKFVMCIANMNSIGSLIFLSVWLQLVGSLLLYVLDSVSCHFTESSSCVWENLDES